MSGLNQSVETFSTANSTQILFCRDGELKLQLSLFLLKKQDYLPVLIQKLMSVKNVRLMLTYSLLLAHKNFQLSIVT